MTSRLRALARERAGIASSLVILAIATKAIVGRVGTFDLGFDDECWILGMGLRLPEWPFPPPDWGPLYAVWYRVLGAIEPDPARLYTFNWLVLDLGLAALLYALSRRSGAPRVAAGVVTIAWCLSHAAMVWPFAAYFATAILALGALAATFTKDGLIAVTMLTIATAIASFVRPELAIPGLLLAAIAIVWSLARAVRSRRPRALGAAIAVLATIAILVRIFGSPLGGTRSYFAFEQHYSLNRVEAGGLHVNPWSDWKTIMSVDFPHARSIAEAARENPSAFAWHIQRNARLLPDRLGWLLSVDDYVPLAMKAAVAWGAGAVLVLGALALASRRRRISPRLLAWLPIWVPVGGSFAAAVLLIRPRDHYLVPFSFFAIAALASACGALSRRPKGRVPPFVSAAGLLAAIAFFALLPTYRRGALPSLVEARGNPATTDWETRNTVAALRALKLSGERVVVEAEYSWAVFAGILFRRVELNEKDRPFYEFLLKHDVDVVIASPRLRDDDGFRDDPEFRSFLEDGGDHRGFVLTKVPRSRTIIAVRPQANH